MKISLPQTKVNQIAKESRKLLRMKEVSARSLARLIGKMTSSIPAVIPALLYYRALQRLCFRIMRCNRYNYNNTGILDQEAIVDLQWWTSSLSDHNGRMLMSLKANILLESDAYNKGWEAFCQGEKAGGPWKQVEVKLHINILELKASFLAQVFSEELEKSAGSPANGQQLSTAIAYINRKGGTHFKILSNLAIEIWEWCLSRNIMVTAEHIAGRRMSELIKSPGCFRIPCRIGS